MVHFRGTGTSEKNIEKKRKNRKNKEPVVLFRGTGTSEIYYCVASTKVQLLTPEERCAAAQFTTQFTAALLVQKYKY